MMPRDAMNTIMATHSAEAAVFLIYVRFSPGVGGIGSVLVLTGIVLQLHGLRAAKRETSPMRR